MHPIPKPYTLIKYLGRGKSAYSYLVEKDKVFYVYKKIHHEPIDFYTFGNKFEHELNAYQKLLSMGLRIPKIIDINHDEEYLIKEYIDGLTIAEAISQGIIRNDLYRAFYFKAKAIENAGLHIDYFPTNFVIYNDELIYVDYEVNAFEDGWGFIEWGSLFWFNQEGFKRYLKDYRDTSKILNDKGMPELAYVKADYDAFIEEIKDLDHDELLHQLSMIEGHPLYIKKIDKLTSGFAARTYKISTNSHDYIYKIYKDPSQKEHFECEVKAYQEPLIYMPRCYSHQTLNNKLSVGWLLFEYIDGSTLMSLYDKTQDLTWAERLADILYDIHQTKDDVLNTMDFVKDEINEIETINHIIQDQSVAIVLQKLKTSSPASIACSRIHGDYHPWNVLIHQEAPYVIDWLYRLGDYRYDLLWAYSLLYRNHYDGFAKRFLDTYLTKVNLTDMHYFLALANLRWFVNVKQSLTINYQEKLYLNVCEQLPRLSELIQHFVKAPLSFTLDSL